MEPYRGLPGNPSLPAHDRFPSAALRYDRYVAQNPGMDRANGVRYTGYSHPGCFRSRTVLARADQGKRETAHLVIARQQGERTMTLDPYDRVVDLVQQGKQDEARKEAVAIPLEHIRTMALVLIERSRPLR